jgi:AraC family transcriptional regulator
VARRFEPVSYGSPRYRTVDVGVFQITHARFPAGLVLAPHVHERACVATTMSGGWNSLLGRSSLECRPASLLVEPPTARHSNHFTVPSDVLVVQPDETRGALEPCAEFLSSVRCFQASRIAALAHRLTDELSAEDAMAALVLEGLALELLATAARGVADAVRPLAIPIWARRARERLHEGPLEGASIRAIAAEVGVHPVHLARIFRACYGTSPGSYARRVRLERVADRVATTDTPLAEIAADAGFADQSHFTRAFRRHTGVSPGAFRRRSRG